MRWEDFKEGIEELDPAKRPWEYDGDGTKIYKLECGFTLSLIHISEPTRPY